MTFCSFTFILLFLPIVLFLYFFVLKSIKKRNILLLIASLLFYAWGEPKNIVFLILAMLLNYIMAIVIQKNKKKKLFFLITLFLNVSLLIYFKYYSFIIVILNDLFNLKINIPNIVVPIGISFYVFQLLSYLIDVYKNEVKAERNFINLALYISFFPQLIAGPIVKYTDIYKQIDKRNETLDKFYTGLKLFIIGLAKKVILADTLAIIVDSVYDKYFNYMTGSTSIMWLAAISFMLQIYFDFSGYSDMAIGMAKMFGFNIPKNFDYPYIASSVSEFWKKWHISLSSWFKKYVYIPLGGSECNKLRWISNIFLIFFLTGLWHGANYNYIAWGIYNGILIILEKTVFKKVLTKIPKFIRYILTLFVLSIGFVIFRISNINELILALKAMFSFKFNGFNNYFYSDFYFSLAFMYIPIAILCCFPLIKLIKKKYKTNEIMTACLLLLLYMLSIFFMFQKNTNIFIYFKF